MTFDEVCAPSELPDVVDEISYQRVVMNAATTWDYFPGHYDPAFAHRQGHPTIFVNTMHIAGFIDRIATDWAGPESRVVRRKMRMLGSVYAGDSMVGHTRVIDKRTETTSTATRYLVDLEIDVSNQHGELCCPAAVTVQLAR